MKVTPFTSETLRYRRFSKLMLTSGYERIEGPWEMYRGFRWRECIADVKFLPGAKDVWIKADGGSHYEAQQMAQQEYYKKRNAK